MTMNAIQWQRLASELRATADSIRSMRTQIIRLLYMDRIPASDIADASTVQVIGLDVANALDRLAASFGPQANGSGTPYDPEHRL